MNKKTKTALTVVGVTAGALGLIYGIRQFNLAKNVKVKAVDFNIVNALFSAGYDALQGNEQEIFENPVYFDLIIVNDSTIEIEVQQVDMEVRFDSQVVGYLTAPFTQVIPAKGEGIIQVDFEFADTYTLDDAIQDIALHFAPPILGQGGDGIKVTIDGNVKSKASIFETINTSYNIQFYSQSEEIL
jgi:hypothetical protein